ncbi:UNVERIFIED_CONTAM: hypothetical protein Scaly_1025100 [Sesamum calycinum]|uniref:Reverse transcriptase domain-containing protein n=1 Tax=Sesamum calycinum TaxID=2727403 RepID=A0AAW2QJP2_9LAMI
MAAFSVCLNGNIHGLFPRARGLRLGDPMSPYFSMLVMEEFANLSGLQANPAKSKLILSKSAHGNREALLQFLSFQLDEDGLDIRDVQALNYALMSKHLWAVISNRDPSIWVQWVRQYRIRHKTVWTVNANAGSWCWRKLLQLRAIL